MAEPKQPRPITGRTKEQKLANFETFFAYIRPTYIAGGLKAASDLVFDMTNVYPTWVRAQNPKIKDPDFINEEFLKMREHLNTAGGIVLVNHPMAPFDSFSVINALHTDTLGSRTDFKILICEEIYMKAYRDNFDPKLFVSPAELATPTGFASAMEHIRNGGVFIIFPSGVNDKDFEDQRFFDGFGDLLLHLAPEIMVYSFYVKPEDTEALKKKHPALFVGLFMQIKLKLPRLLNINHWRKSDTFRVDEWDATAAEWQKPLKGITDKNKYGDILADFYRSKF